MITAGCAFLFQQQKRKKNKIINIWEADENHQDFDEILQKTIGIGGEKCYNKNNLLSLQ
ncbi:MAG TPA: hypothetical protein H9671_02775 [Firmicutes bacterium]|nr:hypothetical protein [Bacillota bacterium]